MYEQLSFLNELGIQKKKEIEDIILKKNYANPCGGCLCEKCSNNVDCMNARAHEAVEACFNCDECFLYNGYGKHNKKYHCDKFLITDKDAEKARKQFKQVN